MTEDIKDYLKELAEDYDVDYKTVCMLYQLMPGELYDGLVSTLEDYAYWRQ